MGNVKFQLNLNKHPKDCPNYSLVDALNVRVSDDFSCLQSEESIISHPTINEYLENNNIELVGVIPCNKELILFAHKPDSGDVASEDGYILRYNEDDDIIKLVYSKLIYHGGKIIGAFTYNVSNELIIAFSEYDGVDDMPLKTINLGAWDGENTTSDELEFDDGKLALTPEVIIPKVSSFDYTNGNSYKGWYYYFIRYKINKNDYTGWFPIGFPVYVDTLEIKNIFRYGLNNGTIENDTIEDSFILNGISDHFSSKDDIANETVILNLSDIDTVYDYFQIGFCCTSKTYSKAFRTSDIKVDSEYEYTMNISDCVDSSVDELITNVYNYYNVKNVINYKNRLYISNYKETKDPEISEEELNKITLSLIPSTKYYDDIKYKNLYANKEYSEQSEDYVNTNPDLIFSQGSITLLTGNQKTIEGVVNLNDLYITTNLGNKIVPLVRRKGFNVTLTFNLGFIYSCDLTILQRENDFIVNVVDAKDFNRIIYISSPFIYINTNNSFKERKLNSTLLPGEVYSFYIHFVNKYGESTSGYKLSNNVKFRVEGQGDKEYLPIPFELTDSEYLLVDANSSIFNDNGRINTTGILIRKNWTYSDGIYMFDTVSTTDIYNALNKIGVSNENPYPSNIKWYEIFSTRLITNNHPFSYYVNNNGDKLFKVPDSDIRTVPFNIIRATIWNLKIDLNDFNIPEGYSGYYLSYEKFEPQIKADGILSKFDVFEQESIAGQYTRYNDEPEDNISSVNFYSNKLNADDLELDYNFIKQHTIDTTIVEPDKSDSYLINEYDSGIISGKYPINYNKVERPGRLITEDPRSIFMGSTYTFISDIQLNKAGNINDGKFGLGSSLSIKLTEEQLNTLFKYRNSLRVSLLKINKNIYTNENKILIKFTNVFYITDARQQTITTGFNGHITYQGTLIYNYNKFIMSAENAILTEQYRPYYRCPIYEGLYDRKLDENRPPIAYVQQACYSDTFYESKSFKNQPDTLFQNLEKVRDDIDDQIMPLAPNIIITPANSIDIFQELQTNQDKLNPKTYITNYTNKSYVYQFDKRVRRSNVIADESLNNSWRSFPLEGYKDISENKGKITNLLGMGTTLLVHTEHSLFAFDGSNTLKTGDNDDIRFTLPDAFDIDYTEVFTSDLGVCGLQDKEAWVAGQFGYIFYDNDAHRIYKFSSKAIEVIDLDIVQFLNKTIPYEIRFAHDVERNRILINSKIYDGQYEGQDRYVKYTLSYNYQLNKFISLHTYSFDKATNTKNVPYLIYNGKLYCNIYDLNNINHKVQRRRYDTTDRQYCYYNNGTVTSPKISIIVNDLYNLIKTIEFISYKMFKRVDSTVDEFNVSDISDRELNKVPYSGYSIRVHNDVCDTGEINVAIDEESSKNIFGNYKKPWWELGNWNFNYLRDIKFDKSSHDIMSRLYGNYFIIDFVFWQSYYNQKIEFENVDVQLIVDETV